VKLLEFGVSAAQTGISSNILGKDIQNQTNKSKTQILFF